jgi:hypothetical protein
MSKAIPSKPPQQTARRTYVVTTTSRVPGRGADARPAPDAAAEVAAEESSEAPSDFAGPVALR